MDLVRSIDEISSLPKQISHSQTVPTASRQDYMKNAIKQSAIDDRYKFTSIILDRYQRKTTSYISRSHNKTFLQRLMGSDDLTEAIESPYTGRKLKPFIWRDFEARPTKLKLLEQIVAFHHL